MEVKDLRNYGKPGCELSSTLSKEVEKRTSKIGREILYKHVGLAGMVRFTFHFITERRRMLKQDLSSLREKGMTNEKFITRDIDRVAMFSAVSRIVGTEKAIQIAKELNEAISPVIFTDILPAAEDFKKFHDPFEALKAWELANLEADERTGHHQSKVVENTKDALQVDVSYCAFYEIAKQLGVKEACLLHCYAHDAASSDLLNPLDIEFKMTNTLVDGASCCDLRFERMRNG